MVDSFRVRNTAPPKKQHTRSQTATPEAGPPPYAPARADGSAVDDVDAVNEWMAGALRARFDLEMRALGVRP